MKYCRTNKAIEWMNDGDIVQNLSTDEYFKKENFRVFVSDDLNHWREFEQPIETFPPYAEWRSVMNLYYYNEIEGEKMYLLSNDITVFEDHPEVDKEKKRWFAKALFY